MSTKASLLNSWLHSFRGATVSQRLVIAGNYVLVLLCLAFLVSGVALYIGDKSDVASVTRVAGPTAPSLRWNWFRRPETAVVAEVKELGELPDATIKAKLLGVMLTAQFSSATISYNGKPEAVYHINDKLDGSTLIKQIEPYRIVVVQNGADKKILLEKSDSIMQTEDYPDEPPAEAPQAQDDGFAMANMFGAVPVNVESFGSGLKLNNLSQEMKQLADIEEGDVVVSVGGLGIESLMSDPTSWTNYSGESNLPVTIIRNGEEMVVYVNAASLSAKMLPRLGLNK